MPAKRKASSTSTSIAARAGKGKRLVLVPVEPSPRKTFVKQTPVKQTRAKQTPIKQTPAKQTPIKQTPIKQTPVKQTPVKQTPAKQTRAKQTPAEQTLVEEASAKQLALATKTMHPDTPSTRTQQASRIASIWTLATSETFYNNVNGLSKKLAANQAVHVAQNYRLKESRDHRRSGDYVLSYEEELHLADHFAFLAHFREGPEFVSAVTIEESLHPPAFTVRLSSNSTPKLAVKEGLERILQIVKDHAIEGRNRDRYKTRLFDEVVILSQKRIYARLRCSQWQVPPRLGGPRPASLSAQIEQHLLRLGAGTLRSALADLIRSIKAVDEGASEDQTKLLKNVIYKSHAVSHHGDFNSLETALQAMRLNDQVCQSREVLEIDKSSKYLGLCDDLIRLSRQPSTRTLCLGLRLEVLQAYPRSKPLGSPITCHVHGEVQLVLFYERHPKQPSPRAIGSSKSACFLCDLFIKKHGGFGISHSHMKLYPMWTIPESSWMNAHQVEHFHSIIQAMTLDIGPLLKKGLYRHSAVIESRAHILQIVQTSDMASSLASTAVSEQLDHNTENSKQNIDPAASAANLMLSRMTSKLYYPQDLPIALDILSSMTSCVLIIGKVNYIFDLEEMEHGRLLVSEFKKDEVSKDLRVNIRILPSSDEYVLNKGVSRSITFYVHDAGEHELRVGMFWDPPPT